MCERMLSDGGRMELTTGSNWHFAFPQGGQRFNAPRSPGVTAVPVDWDSVELEVLDWRG